MSFREDDTTFFELEPFEELLGVKDSMRLPHAVGRGHVENKIANDDLGFDDDPWMAKMCDSDANQFLSSIQKSGRLSRSRIRSKEVRRKPGWHDSRDDYEGYPSEIPMVIQTKKFTKDNNKHDEDLILDRNYQEMSTKISDSLNKTERSNGRNGYIGSRDSGFDGVQPGEGIERRQSTQPLDPPSASTKLILDDLTDLKAKIMNTLVDRGLEPEGTTIQSEHSLSTLLRECQWERAIQCVRLHPEEAGQEIKLPNGNMAYSRDIYSTYPLHLACSFRPLPPTELLQDLIHAYPEACQQFEEPSGMLPIHIAANLNLPVQTNNGIYGQCRPDSPNHSAVVDLLLSSNPESICAREKVNGMTPLHVAASTTRAENGIVSTSASNMLSSLLAQSPSDAVHMWKDDNGMTPYDWAWQNVYYKENVAKLSGDASEIESARIESPQSLLVSEMCLHPFLRNDIRNHLQPTIRLEANKKDTGVRHQARKAKIASLSSTRAKQSPQQNSDSCRNAIPHTQNGDPEGQVNGSIISSSELKNIREYANSNMASRKLTCNKDALGTGTSAILHMKIFVSDLIHPSLHGKRRNSRRNGKAPPNPFLEVFVAHRCGTSKSSYKSYPLRGAHEGTWEDAFLYLGLTRKQLQNGTNGASYIEVGMRLMHCPDNGSNIKLIGTCKVPLEALEKEQQRRLRLLKERQKLNNEVEISLPEPEKYPILKGFEVTGKLQVMSLSIE